MHFVIIGLSHKTTSLDLREKMAISNEKVPSFLKELLEIEDIEEGFLISTCNRVEICLATKHVHKAAEAAKNLLATWSHVSLQELEGHLYMRENGEAIAHFFQVTSGLDSMVVGETQITGQVKEAYARAVSSHATGTYLNKLLHKALNVSKKIRTETGIGHQAVSISYAAVLLAEKIFGDLKEKTVLLVGAGEMGTLAARHLIERQVKNIWLSNRTGERAEGVAKDLGAKSIPYEDLATRLFEADILIASTASANFIIHAEQVRDAMKKRQHRPMFFMDIAVPRNIDPAVNHIENVYLYDIDHLQGIVDANRQEREKEAKKAGEIIIYEVEVFLEQIRNLNLSPTIRQLSQKFDVIRRRELEKYLSRSPAMSAADREAFEACTTAIVNKILHEPILLMKTEEHKEGAPKYSDILRKLFKLESE